MQHFDLLEIQKNIEEKRLILGQKLEFILLKNLALIIDFLKKTLAKESGKFFGPLFIIAISILARSSRDIGPISASNLQENSIIFTEILFNLIGIFSLYCSIFILKRSDLVKDPIAFNLLIFSFAGGFFLQAFTTQFNEFYTRSSGFLAVFFPLFSFSFIKKSNLKNYDKILILLLTTLSIYLAYSLKNSEINLFLSLKEDIFPIFLLIFLCFPLIKNNNLLLSIIIASSLISRDYEQRAIFYSLSLPLIILTIKNYPINWKKDGIFLLLILLVPNFDQKYSFDIALNLCLFWWIFALFLPRNPRYWFYLIALASTSIALSFNPKTAELSWILSAIFFTLTLKKLPRIHIYAIFVILSYVLNLYLNAIFNFENSAAFEYKSPNYVSQEMAKTIKRYSSENEKIAIISKKKYSFLVYLKKNNSDFFDQNNKLIFIERNDLCKISPIEQRDFKNYIFLNRIIQKKTLEKEVSFFKNSFNLSNEIIEQDVEIYIKK